MEMEQIELSKTLAYKIRMPGNYPEESIQLPMTLLTRQLQVCRTDLYWGMWRKWIRGFGEKTSGGL
jgi:hypothetical protein